VRPGLFCFPIHQNLIDVITRLQPSVVKAFSGATSDSWWKEVKQVSPGSIRVLVHGEISDNPSLLNPEADAEATAQYLSDKPNCPRLVILKNEPPIWDSLDKRRQVEEYTVRWLIRGHQLGLNAVVCEFNSGWPRVSLLDAENWWPDFSAIDGDMNIGDYVGLHGYWGMSGPRAMWPWTVGRHLRCPTKRNILIDEVGFDRWTDGPLADKHMRGWKANRTINEYTNELIEYHQMLNNDPRVKGTCLFTMDFDNQEWFSFDSWDLRDTLVARVAEFDIKDKSVVVPTRIANPMPGHVITARFGEKNQFTQFHLGLDFSAVQGTPVLAAAGGVVDKVLDLQDKSYGKYITINHGWGFTLYAHLSEFLVQKGAFVNPGDRIGLSGDTGYSFGGHLHFEVQDFSNHNTVSSYRVDPYMLIFEGDTDVESIIGMEAQRHVIPLNPNAAFQIAGKAKGLTLAGDEFDITIDGIVYRAQAFRKFDDPEHQHIVYAQIPLWNQLTWFLKDN
jgi:hypothetical protein